MPSRGCWFIELPGIIASLQLSQFIVPDLIFRYKVLKALSKLRRDADLLDALKPNVTANDVKRTVVQNGEAFHVTSKRYKSRIRRDTQVAVLILV